MTLPRLLTALLVFLGAATALAQDDANSDNTSDAIRVTTALHEDGTKTVTEVHPDDHSSTATTYDSADRVTQKIVYQLNDQNQPATGVVYGPDGQAAYKTEYKYDDTPRMLEEDDFTMDDQLLRRFVYEYGADGKVARIRAFDADGTELTEDGGTKDQQQEPPRRHH